MADQDRCIKKLEVRYLLDTDVKAPDGTPHIHEEKLILDRDSNTITFTQIVSTRHHITKTCYVEDGIADLLDEFEPEQFSEIHDTKPLVQCESSVPHYEISLHLENGTILKTAGVFDQMGLPWVWSEFLDAIYSLTRPLHHDEMFNPDIYSQRFHREQDMIVCNVQFHLFGQTYTYLAHEDIYKAGDKVIVPAGPKYGEKIAYIDSILYCTRDELDYPLEELKYIIRKAEEENKR